MSASAEPLQFRVFRFPAGSAFASGGLARHHDAPLLTFTQVRPAADLGRWRPGAVWGRPGLAGLHAQEHLARCSPDRRPRRGVDYLALHGRRGGLLRRTERAKRRATDVARSQCECGRIGIRDEAALRSVCRGAALSRNRSARLRIFGAVAARIPAVPVRRRHHRDNGTRFWRTTGGRGRFVTRGRIRGSCRHPTP